MIKRHQLLVGCLAVLSLTVAACSSPTASESTTSAAAPAASGSATADTATAAEEAADALGIDLSSCPTDPTVPFPSEINVGNTAPQTGPVAAALGVIQPAMKLAFDEYNSTYGLSTKFNLISSDDAFSPDKALAATQTLIDKDDIQLMTSVIGTAQVAAVRELLGTECIPLVPGVSGGSSANVPTEFPWTVVYTLPFAVDARIWLADVKANHPDDAKIGILYSNTESGKDYLAAVKKYLGTSTIVAEESIEATDTGAPSSQITTLRASGANVLFAAVAASQCATTMNEVASQGWDADFYLTGTCGSGTFDVSGEAANGVKINTYFKDPTRGQYVTDPDVVSAVEMLTAAGIPVNNTSLGGFIYPSILFEAAKAASESPLGLSRLGVIDAATHLDFQPALALPGVRFKVDGLTDQWALESAVLTEYNSTSKEFDNIKLYDFEGQMTG